MELTVAGSCCSIEMQLAELSQCLFCALLLWSYCAKVHWYRLRTRTRQPDDDLYMTSDDYTLLRAHQAILDRVAYNDKMTT